jgi:hypothetical protein
MKMIFLLLVLTQFANAKTFRNAYIAFDLPEGWNCVLEATEWVCRSQDPKSSKEAIIIFTAKEVGPTDSFPIYEQTMNTERTLTSKSGAPIKSQVTYKAKQVKINDHPWIDGMQKSSEVPNYFTRYVATLKEKIAILVTFSAHRDHYAKYSKDFYNAIMSLRVIASKGLLQRPDIGSSGSSGGGPGGIFANSNSGISMDGPVPKAKSPKGGLTKILMALGGILAAAAGYFYLKKK